jgi:hypothetical protein
MPRTEGRILARDSPDDSQTGVNTRVCPAFRQSSISERTVGFASRGLIVLYPISRKALLLWSDPEAYTISFTNGAMWAIRRQQDIIDFNLAQFSNADENVYFSDPSRVQATIDHFSQRESAIRATRPTIKETLMKADGGKNLLLLELPRPISRFVMPNVMTVRYAVTMGRFRTGHAAVRNPALAHAVKQAMNQEYERRSKNP